MRYFKTLLVFIAASSLLFAGCSDDDENPDTGNDAVSDMEDDGDGTQDTDTTEDTDGDGTTEAQPLGPDNKPALGTMLDRTGRPAVTTALVGTFNPDEAARKALKDDYNTAVPADWASYASDIASGLAVLDGLDTTCGNQFLAESDVSERYTALSGALAEDFLLLNTTKSNCTTYLGVEAQTFLPSVEDGGCGGRAPSYDVVDQSYTVLAAGALDQSIGDMVDSDDGGSSDTEFPFLGAPTQ